MRFLAQFAWGFVILIALMILAGFIIANISSEPLHMSVIGYRVGRIATWLAVISGVFVWFASSKGWLPGVRKPER